jgi:hypothetical protein
MLGIAPSYAQEQTHHAHQHLVKNNTSSSNTIKIALEKTPKMINANKPVTIRFQLLKENKALTYNELKEVHTKKIHVLIIDPSLSDYHHVHPIEESQSQSFILSFTPKYKGAYQMWVDITPENTNQQQFLVTSLGTSSKDLPVQEEIALSTKVSPYEFTLKLDSEPEAGLDVMATITVTKNGKPFTELEPIMGAFAHVVGFSSDHSSVVHIHPMGKEPENESDRGGSQLMFHIGLKNPGFVKLFAQFRINGQEVYVPFGIKVG